MPLRDLITRPLLALALANLTACANLDAVRDFGSSAARMAAYPKAAQAYRDSALTSAPYVSAAQPGLVDAAARSRQAAQALKLQVELGRYFATLAKLAGEDTYAIDTQLDALGKGAAAVPDSALDAGTLQAYTSLAKAVSRFVLLGVQERAVKELVSDGGPHAMRILGSLRQSAQDWSRLVAGDARQADATLEVAVLPADVPPLLRVLATDRRGTLQREYDGVQQQFKQTLAALDAVEKAHASMVEHLDDLNNATLRSTLKASSADLKAASAVLASWR
jgi:hypothetical protein